MNKKFRYYGIKFPFTRESQMNTYIDLNENKLESVKSELIHLIYTPVGTRLRNPNFGTRLIQFLFSPNDNQAKTDVEFEIKEAVKRNIPDCEINNMDINMTEDGLGLDVSINFSATINGETVNDNITLTV